MTADHAARAAELLAAGHAAGRSPSVRVQAGVGYAILALADAVAGRAVRRPRWDDDLAADPAVAADRTHRPNAVHVRQPGIAGGPDTCRVHGLLWAECTSPGR